MKERLSQKVIFRYLYDQLTGNFTGFLIGMSATSLVSHFFETRSIKNLWGLAAKKTVVNKETFSQLEWILSIIIGFIVFEIVTKVLKERAEKNFPIYKQKILRWAVEKRVRAKIQTLALDANTKGLIFFTAVNTSVKRMLRK